MNTYISQSTTKNSLRSLLALSIIFLFGSISAIAQQTTGDIDKKTDINPGTTSLDGAVRVIDNKGTIKYLQVQNGLTLISNTTDDVTTTTWQLGGTLTDDTYIDADGNVFALDGLKLEEGSAATTVVTESTSEAYRTAYDTSIASAADPAAPTAAEIATAVAAAEAAAANTGWALLVRDEATGEIKKLLATDLVISGQTYFTVADDGDTVFNLADATDVPDGGTIAALTTAAPLPAFAQVFVYRNGAKLLAGVDYTITAPSSVTLVPGTTAPNEWSTYSGDIIEVHYFK